MEITKLLFCETDYIPLLDITSSLCCSLSGYTDVTFKAASINSMGVQTINNRKRRMYSQLSEPKLKDYGAYVDNAEIYDVYEIQKEIKTIEDTNLVTLRLLANNIEPLLPWKIDSLIKTTSNDKNIKFSSEIVQELCDLRLGSAKVVNVHWNTFSPHIFAASLMFASSGGVAIFSLKNPLSAEKYYAFAKSVTCSSFSRKSPNLLAVGFTRGDLWIIDISSSSLKIIHKMTPLTHEIVQFIQWWDLDGTDAIVLGCANKVICLKRPFLSYRPYNLITLFYKSNEAMITGGSPLSLGPIPTCLLRNSIDTDQYVIGATDGYLRNNSLNRSSHNLKIIKAHNGLVCQVKPLPYCHKGFITCGSDGFIKLWMWDFEVQILQLEITCTPLIDLSWSPLHATVVIAISTDSFYIWDIRRKTYSPIATKKFPYHLHSVEFSNCGKWITVGTGDGKIVFISLFDMPHPEYLKRDAFYNGVIRCLQTSGKIELATNIKKHYQ